MRHSPSVRLAIGDCSSSWLQRTLSNWCVRFPTCQPTGLFHDCARHEPKSSFRAATFSAASECSLHCQAATDVEVAVGLPAHDDDLVVRLAAETNHAAKAHVIHRTPTVPASAAFSSVAQHVLVAVQRRAELLEAQLRAAEQSALGDFDALVENMCRIATTAAARPPWH